MESDVHVCLGWRWTGAAAGPNCMKKAQRKRKKGDGSKRGLAAASMTFCRFQSISKVRTRLGASFVRDDIYFCISISGI